MNGEKKIRTAYLSADLTALTLGWLCFSFIRFTKKAVIYYSSLTNFLFDIKSILDLLLLLICWMLLFFLSGYYNNVVGKSRLDEFFQTLFSVLLGAVGIFFLVILDDIPWTYRVYYNMIVYLFVSVFFFVYTFRLIITQVVAKRIRSGKITQKCIVIGTGNRALSVTREINSIYDALKYDIKGYISLPYEKETVVEKTKIVGTIDDLGRIINHSEAEEIIIAIDPDDDRKVIRVLYTLYKYNRSIKLYAGKSRILTGSVHARTLVGIPLINLTKSNFSDCENNIKFVADRIISLFGLILFSPLFLYLALRVRIDSQGPVFFSQWRIGYRGKPFKIWKFRTMYKNDSETAPLLTIDSDPRVTPYGRIMRKFRLDELPQLWNVLKGEMSLVGPRPEQKYYIDEIIKAAPYYYLLHNVRPGITSWGMVKYGYASTVEQMIKRLQYDILYYENMSLLIDLKIIIYTIRTILTGKGV